MGARLIASTKRPDHVRIARGCWATESPPLDLIRRCALLLDTSAADTVVVGVTAARLYDLWLPRLPNEIHLATAAPQRVGRHMTRTRRPEVHAHRRQLRDDDRSVVCGLPVLTLANTWRDLATVLDLPALVAAGDRALQLGMSRDDLGDVLTRRRTRPGARRAADAAQHLDARSRSRPESHLRVAASAPGMPRFAVNEPVYRAEGGWLAEPDLSLTQAKLALEYQGSDHAELARLRRDVTRVLDLQREGWLTLAFGPAEVFGNPDQVRADVYRALRERAPHLLGPRRPHAQRAAG